MGVVRIAAAGVILVAATCCATTGPSPSPRRVELIVLAAASLTEVLAEARAAYEAVSPSTALTISTDSSAALRTQIEHGAPADVFLSADTASPHALVDAGLTDGDAVDFAANALTIVVPTDNPAAIATPADLARAGVQIVAAGEQVPITPYAIQVVSNLGTLAGYPADFAARYAANVVSREANVRAVVARIELGEGDAAIVYATDAVASTGVVTIDIPDEANVHAGYAGVVVGGSPSVGAARAFLDWLAGAGGRHILARHGFLAPRER